MGQGLTLPQELFLPLLGLVKHEFNVDVDPLFQLRVRLFKLCKLLLNLMGVQLVQLRLRLGKLVLEVREVPIQSF